MARCGSHDASKANDIVASTGKRVPLGADTTEPNRGLCSLKKRFTTLRCSTSTPLGRPVDPDV